MLLSCTSKVDCEYLANRLSSAECNIIVIEEPNIGRSFRLWGVNPTTKYRETYYDEEAWYVSFGHKIAIGDTVVKNPGELKFYIHKKDTVLVYPFQCGEKVYE
ncbi:hypothetical protein AHMF7605_27050 [Adhaeribacter arboris]|uniref:Uncharacterized protein n=1 Tax=Adhaeribacter arboris TaxID=2072846 RepID=A0A2T2YMZ8_9BACT|nr:hypothetical protein AHMF7605_26990 [Adhaeribacter arboris]PSR56894.1 hypothetical protein AHMF7605_27050 [Adhaeribacter arboris]